MSDPEKSDQPTTGPEPERLKIEGDWEEAVKRALSVEKPGGGWPKTDHSADESEQNPA